MNVRFRGMCPVNLFHGHQDGLEAPLSTGYSFPHIGQMHRK